MIKIFRYEQSEEEVRNDPNVSIFLAGPTVRGNQPHLISWRFPCIDEFEKQKFNDSLIIPEFTDKSQSDKGKDWIPLWEFNGLKKANCILFWIPRTRELIGLTTNWELGYWMGHEPQKILYGRPDGAYRTRYLDIMWEATFLGFQHFLPKIYNTLEAIVQASIELASTNC